MRLREFKNRKFNKKINKIQITGVITSNKDTYDFGESLFAIHPFNADSLVPLVIEGSTTHIIETDDGFETTRKNVFNVNAYGDLIDKIVDNTEFVIGSRVSVTGYLISKNYCKTEERTDIMNLCNRYKNLHDGERPFLCEGDRPFLDKQTGVIYTKNLIDWNLLLGEGLLENIPDEEAQEQGKVEFFYTEEGKVYRLENKTNYIVMAKDIEVVENYIDPSKGDENYIEVSGTAKDVYVYDYEGYQSGHICIVSKSADMTRNSYIHVILKGKDLEALKCLNFNDMVHVKGKLKHRTIEKEIIKKKGKKELVKIQTTNIYEIDCREIDIYKTN